MFICYNKREKTYKNPKIFITNQIEPYQPGLGSQYKLQEYRHFVTLKTTEPR